MIVAQSGSTPPRVALAENFTGHVEVELGFTGDPPARCRGSYVTFQPGARTNWHTHPLGQTLVVTAGQGRVQCWGGQVRTVGAGDVVWFPPGEKHWHGAAPDTAFTHFAIVEALDGKTADWLERVTDAQYDGSDGRVSS